MRHGSIGHWRFRFTLIDFGRPQAIKNGGQDRLEMISQQPRYQNYYENVGENKKKRISYQGTKSDEQGKVYNVNSVR